MKIFKRLILIFATLIGCMIVVFAAGYGILSAIVPNPEKDRAEHIDNPTGYIKAYGKNIYDEKGDILFLKGVSFGDWFDQEYWMAAATVGEWVETDSEKIFETGIYTPKRGLAAMRANKNLTEEQIKILDKLYIDTFIQEVDFKNVAGLGMNCVRINFTCYNVTTDGYEIDEAAFDKIDWALDMCEKYNLYVILDDHGAIGSQNKDNHSGNDETFDLYGNEKNEGATIALWEYIAKRYKGRYKSVIAGFDLLNEPRSAAGKYAGKINFDFYDKLYKAIRAIDSERMLVMECFTFPTHGVCPDRYGWENVAYSYHFYNLTPFSEGFAVNFYRVTHNLKGYNVPIIVGEFSAWDKEKGWEELFDSFGKNGWSYLSWTYKANKYLYKGGVNFGKKNTWGIYELDFKPVNIYTATFEEIYEVYSKVGTENAEKSVIYNFWKNNQNKNI